VLNGDLIGALIVLVISLFVGFGAYRALGLAKEARARPQP
jgi:hypothetical protein